MFFIGLTASYFQEEAIKMWYPLLSKPELTPPNVVFPIAWSIIYLCMGISIGIIFLSNSIKRKELIKLFGIQLIFNFTWSILFFYLRNRGSRNLVGIIVSYSHPKFRPLPHGNKSIGGVGSHRASL